MARVLVGSVWYEQVEPSTFYEGDFENRIAIHAPTIYPDFYVFPFKLTMESEYGNAKPDLVFVSKEYDEWYIVEVELGHHSLSGHVEPQVAKLIAALYGEREADYVLEKATASNVSFDPARLKHLIINSLPKMLVIINEPKPIWRDSLANLGATVALFELFRSDDGSELFRVNGEYPVLLIDSVSLCSPHPIVASYLEVHTPDAIELPLHGRIKLRFNKCMTEWERVDAEGRVWLKPVGRDPLNPRHQYQIFKQRDGTYVLQRNET